MGNMSVDFLKKNNGRFVPRNYSQRTTREVILRNNIGKMVRHFKGDLYLILDIAEHTESRETLVIYKALYGDCNVYARPLEMFLSKVDTVKHPNADQEYRMEFIEVKSVKE